MSPVFMSPRRGWMKMAFLVKKFLKFSSNKSSVHSAEMKRIMKSMVYLCCCPGTNKLFMQEKKIMLG